jgi:hypothetical protein
VRIIDFLIGLNVFGLHLYLICFSAEIQKFTKYGNFQNGWVNNLNQPWHVNYELLPNTFLHIQQNIPFDRGIVAGSDHIANKGENFFQNSKNFVLGSLHLDNKFCLQDKYRSGHYLPVKQ